MFIKQQIFEKLLKTAYKRGGFSIARLKVADEDGEMREKYIIMAHGWRIETVAEYLPKEAKASIIKLIDDLPDLGECYKASADMIQSKMPETVIMDMPDGKIYELNKTNMYIRIGNVGMCRIYQAGHKEIYVLNTLFDEAVSISAIDEEYESVPAGPFVNNNKNHIVFWKNETTLFQVGKIYIDEESYNNEIIGNLEKIALWED